MSNPNVVWYYHFLRRWNARPTRLRTVLYAFRLWWVGRQWFDRPEGYRVTESVTPASAVTPEGV